MNTTEAVTIYYDDITGNYSTYDNLREFLEYHEDDDFTFTCSIVINHRDVILLETGNRFRYNGIYQHDSDIKTFLSANYH